MKLKKTSMLKLLLFVSGVFYLTGIYDLSLSDANGNTFNLGAFKGKKILLVNVASSGKYSNQLSSLEQLYQKYKDSLVVIAVPSNSFGNEQRSDSEIKQYLSNQFHAHFIITGKVSASGSNQSAVFKWLTHSNENKVMDNTINGDFWKFLIDEKGNLVGAFVSSVDPMSEAIQSAVQMRN
jgi:glutathione peroxidase